MKRIIINSENKAKVEQALNEVQKRSKVRTIDIYDIYDALETVERHLGIPKSYMNGIKVRVDPNAQAFPNAYKFNPESTHFTAEYKNGHWVLTDIYRATTERTKKVQIELTDQAKEKILESISVIKQGERMI